jgi:polar amino acid transport system substrate-binding protein
MTSIRLPGQSAGSKAAALCLCLLQGAPGPSPAIAATGPLSFAVIDAPPYGALLSNGTATGIYPALLAHLSAEAAMPFKITVVPFARAVSMVGNEQADGTILFKTSVTEGSAIALLPLFSTNLVLIQPPGSKRRERTELAGRLIGRLRGGCQDLEADAGVRFYELNSQQQGVSMLIAGRIDAFCTAEESLNWAIGQFDAAGALALAHRMKISERQVWLHVRRHLDPHLAERLKAALLRMKADGTIERIVHAKPAGK